MVAGVSIDEERIGELNELGVRDSKLHSPGQRTVLYPEILRLCDFVESAQISPAEIDRVVRTGRKFRKLNFLEARYMAKVIDRLGADRVFVDSCDTVPKRFAATITEQLKSASVIVAKHHADRDLTVVSAASIVAKVERDRAVALLRAEFGDFGSGYPSDPRTRVFFIEWLRREEKLPPFVRKSWKTWAALEQSVLAPF